MPMLGAILTPHPPVLLSEVGRGKELEIDATDRAMHAAAECQAAECPVAAECQAAEVCPAAVAECRAEDKAEVK